MSAGFCKACGQWTERIERHHVKSKGAGGSDDLDNLIALCREHHAKVHQTGWVVFINEHPALVEVLKKKGWEVVELFGLKRLRRSL